MKKLIVKYRHLILYGIFGILTTLVNIAAYWVCTRLFHMPTVPATVTAWVAAVLFAYFTNRKWVFESGAKGAREIIAECAKFFALRAATGVLDIIIMYVSVDVLGWNDVLMKVVSNIVVILLNYIASRFVIFKKK